MAEQKADPKAGQKSETAGTTRVSVLAALGKARRAYNEELHNAWLALHNAGRDAQNELHAKIIAANTSMNDGPLQERFARAHNTYMTTQRAIMMGGSPEAWQQFKTAQDDFVELDKQATNLRDAARSRVDEANQEYAKSLKDASAEVQKRYEAAFRTFLAAQQTAFKEMDVNTIDPVTLIEIGRNLIEVGDNARFNLSKS